jgi:hypothetical protein
MPSGYTAKTSVARLGSLVLGFAALAVFAGCAGRTTGASDITEQPDGSYAAKLNAVGTCDEGSSSTPCTVYMRWREVGTDAWTESPSTKVDRKVRNRPFSYTARDLSPETEYEYQACGKEFSQEQVFCAGPDGSPATAEKFVATERPTEAREAANDVGSDESGAKGGPASNNSNGSQRGGSGSQSGGSGSQSGGDGGTSPVPIVIAVGAVGLVLGGAWWARRQAYW